MSTLTRRQLLCSTAAATLAATLLPTALSGQAHAEVPKLVPRKLPFPNDKLGTYEPTISADGNTIYFARFANNGDTSVKGATDIFVTRRVQTSGEWPGKAEDWSPAERLTDAVNSDSVRWAR